MASGSASIEKRLQAMNNGWFNLSMQMMKLAMESQVVIVQRLWRLQAGGTVADREARRMVSEKTTAAASEAMSLGMALSTGRPPLSAMRSTVKSYRKKVSANRRRLAPKNSKRK
jgi:hypothetical protein